MNNFFLNFKNKNVPHAIILECKNLNYSFKTAMNFISGLLCTSKKENKPCLDCSSCIKIEKKIHPDVKLFFPEENSNSLKIEKIRFIRQDCYIAPNEGKYKVYVFSPAETLTPQAQNAFIKILEEPPKNVIFILLCKSSELLLDTVLSRCERFFIKEENLFENKENLKEKCKEIFKLSASKNKVEILKIFSKFPQERSFFSDFILEYIDELLDLIKTQKNITSIEDIAKKIDDLKFSFKLIEKNVNINLVLSYLISVL